MTKEQYNLKAIEYAEKYGIITYRVKGKYMTYNQNYHNKEFIGGEWRDNPCTYQRQVNLENGETSCKRLQRLQKDGWNNV